MLGFQRIYGKTPQTAKKKPLSESYLYSGLIRVQRQLLSDTWTTAYSSCKMRNGMEPKSQNEHFKETWDTGLKFELGDPCLLLPTASISLQWTKPKP